mmetsp:Transcript_25603/g.39665  ORF Transcript_25603/g.39665 Transcript_25603/m.39665 type:complete len:672 (-) Transcript_25603:317-2332(-)|eukprot:CAMPEP_0196801728 /NCGR_PEP_ID=MMETSP1362-20130617/1506_1 /TAXON_ID=163516 /ORGANISM="Leptocylindrus danicus, Strain CCMP1856" /LENGTH=671 /DNA_ID=CAMNT_0042172825 /DNA_START=339 /DNA_END=2354 /DNA_ORIENTATION=-
MSHESSSVTLRWVRISKTVEVKDETKGLIRSSISAAPVTTATSTPNSNIHADRKTLKKRILDNFSGQACPGEILALMGPSGSGKTSLLDVLSGRSKFDADLNSYLSINGAKSSASSMKTLKRKVAYVRQKDVFFDHLTVRDQLTYTALLRLPSSKNKSEKHAEVNRIIAQLKLTKCADSPICFVSGGERKRVNIGTELLTDPSVVILDEPTSGLDSTSAVALMKMLKKFARSKNKTVISSIHQPSSAVFASFDKIMFLAEGHIVFYGTPAASLRYLDEKNLSCPAGYNAADHWMDLLVVDSARDQEQQEEDTCADADIENATLSSPDISDTVSLIDHDAAKHKLIEEWNNEELASQMEKNDKEFHASANDDLGKNGDTTIVDSSTKFGSSWWTQLTVLTHRCMKNSRSAIFTPLNIVKSAAIGLVIGLLWFQMDYTEKTVDDRSSFFFFTMTFWVFDSMFTAMMAFPMEREVIFKERASGTYHLSSYFLAKTISEAPTRLALPMIYMFIAYWLSGLNNSISIFIGTTGCTLLSVMSGESIGLLMGATIMDFERALVVMTVVALALMVVGGFFVQNIPTFASWLKYISPFKYAFDASKRLTFDRDVPCDGSGVLETVCLGQGTGYATVGEVLDYLDVQGSVAFNVLMLVVLSIVCRLGAFYALKTRKAVERT